MQCLFGTKHSNHASVIYIVFERAWNIAMLGPGSMPMRPRRHNRLTVVIRRSRGGPGPRSPIARDCRPIGKFPMIADQACDMPRIVLAREAIIQFYHNVKGIGNDFAESGFNGIAIRSNILFLQRKILNDHFAKHIE